MRSKIDDWFLWINMLFLPRLLLPWKHGKIQKPPVSFVLPAFSTSSALSCGTWTPSSAQNCNSSDQLCQLSWGHSFRSGQMFLDFPFMCLPQLHAWWHFAAGAASYLKVLHILHHRKVYLEFNFLKLFQWVPWIIGLLILIILPKERVERGCGFFSCEVNVLFS